MTKKNVLMFITHDQGDFLSCYGHSDVKTPNLDRLAENGVRFSNYFAVSPECTASRSGMLTGLYSHQNGLYGLGHFGWKLTDPNQHLAARMRDNGYETYLFGLQHETSGSGEELGYMNTFTESKQAGDVCEKVCEFLRERVKNDAPWFAHAGFFQVHRIWPEETTFLPEDVIVPGYLPDTPEVRNDYTMFYQNIADMDEQVGKVIDELDRLGLRDDTLIVFTSDHGSPFPHAKSTFFDPGIKIPLIMSHPEFEKGKTIPALGSNIDYSPTILDFCGFETPEKIEGISMMPLIKGETDVLHEEVCGSIFFDVSYDPMYYIRTNDFKYIRSFGVDDSEVADIHPDVRCSYMAGSWIRLDDYDVLVNGKTSFDSVKKNCEITPPVKEEFYDLNKDPLEFDNLAENPAYSQQLEKMRLIMKSMLERTGAPVPGHHVKPTPCQIEQGSKYLKNMNEIYNKQEMS